MVYRDRICHAPGVILETTYGRVEFRRGEQYAVDLQSDDGEVVTVRFPVQPSSMFFLVLGVGQCLARWFVL